MREHQIVITLKPEQFLEIQRLARAANAKSMGIFVRQQLLAALGIEGSASSPAEKHDNPDLAPIAGELRRLHSELKTFVAESLSLYAMEPAADTPVEPGTITTDNALGESVAFPQQSAPLADDFLEQVAERTFAISPRLGAIGEDLGGTDAAGRDSYAGTAADSGTAGSELVAAPTEDTLSVEPELALAPVMEQEELPLSAEVADGALSDEVLEQHTTNSFSGFGSAHATELPAADADMYEVEAEFAGTELLTGRTSANNGASESAPANKGRSTAARLSKRDVTHRYHPHTPKDDVAVPQQSDVQSAPPIKERFEESVVAQRDARIRPQDVMDLQPGLDDDDDDFAGGSAGEDVLSWREQSPFSYQQSAAPLADDDYVPPAPKLSDPLDRLLGGTDFESLNARKSVLRAFTAPAERAGETDEDDVDDEDYDDDDLYDVPLSIAERRRQLSEQGAGEPAQMITSASAEMESASAASSVQSMPGSSTDEDNNAADRSPLNPASAQGLAENTVSQNLPAKAAPVPPKGSKPSPERPLGYPPVSGNPPPKRRQV